MWRKIIEIRFSHNGMGEDENIPGYDAVLID
jgi:hypothetical protein